VRLAFVSHSPWLGGAERCLLELVTELVPRGHEVAVVLPQDGPLRPRLEAAGAATRVAWARWWARDPGMPWKPPHLAGAARTARVLRALRPDVVVSNSMVHPAGALAAGALGLPHAWWVHELGVRDHGFRFALGLRGTLRAVHALSHAVLVSSRTVAEVVGGRPRHVPYAVDVPVAPEPAAEAPARLLVAGRVRPSKCQHDAVRALAALPGARLDVVGAGDLAWLRAEAERAGVADRVTLHGAHDDLVPWLDRAGVVVVPSRNEALGRVAVEAFKRGRPVVGARSAGTAELVREGETGLTYAPGDAAGLARAVRTLLADDALRARLARGGWQWARTTFTPARSADAFEAAVCA
jgi:glycosyltransferase involved in cell wall biosynthesis